MVGGFNGHTLMHVKIMPKSTKHMVTRRLLDIFLLVSKNTCLLDLADDPRAGGGAVRGLDGL